MQSRHDNNDIDIAANAYKGLCAEEIWSKTEEGISNMRLVMTKDHSIITFVLEALSSLFSISRAIPFTNISSSLGI
jgi:hypothetical protein